MATEMLNIQDYSGYIKCGEILKSPLPTYQYPYILKCYQCDTINFVLESFIIHIQEHCNYGKSLTENIDIKIPPEDAGEEIENNEAIENPIVKIETITMDVDDPLIVIKDEVVEENNPPQEVETYDYSKEQNENDGDYSSNSDNNYQSDDYDSEEECTLKKEQKSMVNHSNFCETNIEAEHNTNCINSPDLNIIRNEFKKDIQRTELVLSNEIKRQTDIIKRYLDKFLEHTKVITDQKIIPIKTNIIPKQPFSTIEEFLKFENIIKNDEEKYNQLVTYFGHQTGSSIQSFVKSIWRTLIVDGAAQHMCWKGTDKKTPVRSLAVTQALKAACVQKFSLEADLNFEKISIHHFQQAKGRHQKKLNYISRNKTTNT